MDFKFEGLATADPTLSTFMGSTGFSTSSTTTSNIMYAGIQKSAGQANTNNYQFFIAGGGFSSSNITYASIGDDTADANDQTDRLRITLTLTKSTTTDQFDATATLVNLDTSDTVATIAATLTRANAYSADLFGYLRSSGLVENNNFDLFDVDAYSYTASTIPEKSTYSMILGGVALIITLSLRRKHTSME